MSRFQLGDYWLSRQSRSDHWCRTWFDKRTRQTRRSSLGTSDLERAKVELARWFVRFSELKDEEPSGVPVSVVLDRYYAQHGSTLPSQQTQKRAVALWLAFWGDATVADMPVARQEQFVAWLRARGLSEGYVRRVVGVGKAALNRAYQRQEIKAVPFVRLSPAESTFDLVATTDQVAAFLNAIPPQYEHLWAYAMIRLNTACRGDAARDLQPFQVDFGHKLVRLNPKGRKQTKKRRPVVPLTDALAAVLKEQSGPYYVNWRGKKVASVKRAWGIVREKAGLPVTWIPKVLRHTAATELRKRGVPGWEASGMLGHRRGEAESTTEVYAKYDPAFMSKARKALDQWMREIAGKVPRLAALTRNSHATGRKRRVSSETVG